MFNKTKISFNRPSLSKRYKSSYKSREFLNLVEKALSSKEILITPTINSYGLPLSSQNYNQFILNNKYNLEYLFTNLHSLSDLAKEDIYKYGHKLQKDIMNFEDKISHFQLQKNNYLFNFFLNKGVVSKIVNDPLLNLKFDKSQHMSFLENVGFTTPITKSLAVPINLIVTDHADSFIGKVIEEDYSYTENKSKYRISFFSPDSNTLGNPFIRQEQSLSVVVKIPGIQLVNRLEFVSYSKYRIDTLSYLNSNEEILPIEFISNRSIGKEILTFENTLVKSLIIKLKLTNPTDNTKINQTIGRVYCFSFDEINLFLESYADTSFLVTDSIHVKTFNGLSIVTNKEENDYLLDIHCVVQTPSSKFTFQVKDSYVETYSIPLYFVKNSCILEYIPETLTVFVNGTETTDYSLYSSLSEDSVELSTIDSTKKQTIQIKLNNFDPRAFYYAEIKPKLGIYSMSNYSFSSNSVMFLSTLSNATINFILIWRKVNQTSSKIPNIKSLSVRVL